jgi:predicted aldo/keto reductase-like oxidoreductase
LNPLLLISALRKEKFEMETRPFGKTGASFPILSFGAQRIVDEEGCNQDQALEILNTALERGIRYFDTAWIY